MTHPSSQANGQSLASLHPDALLPPTRPVGRDNRSPSAASYVSVNSKAPSTVRPAGLGPGTFTSELRSFSSRTDLPLVPLYAGGDDGTGEATASEQRQAEYRLEIEKQTRLKAGTENFLEALNSKNAKKSRGQRLAAENQLNTSNRTIAQLQSDLAAEIQRGKEQPASPPNRISQFFRPAHVLQPDLDPFALPPEAQDGQDPELESPTYILAEIIQALEADDMPPDYYVRHANDLVELFRRHPTLKYDLAWSIFGIRVQFLLLSDSREAVAAGYRVMRYAITDRKSLQTIRSLKTDYLVVLSLVKEAKARVEREQALKFVRAFIDVKDGIQEISPAVVRIIVAVADHADDQLRCIAIMTLAEMLLKDPMLVVNAGGIGVLTSVMGNGIYHAPETILGPLLQLMDLPARRGVLRSGFEFSAAFATFTEPHTSHSIEEKLASSSRVVAGMFKSWAGLMTLSLHDFLPVRSVISALYVNDIQIRSASLDLLMDILRIERRSWSTPFIGGRRLTTYARVANLDLYSDASQNSNNSENHRQKRHLVQHFTALALAILLRQGLMDGLLHAERESPTMALKRSTGLIIAEVLKKASELLPLSWSADLQAMPALVDNAVKFGEEERYRALHTAWQIDKVNLKLWRSAPEHPARPMTSDGVQGARERSASKTQVHASMDEVLFRQRMLDTGVLNSVNYIKWDWAIILELIDGPLTQPRLLFEAIEKSKFVHRLLKFLRPFQFRFSDSSNIKANQRYVRMACTLVKTLLQTVEGANYLINNKTIRQLAESLAQLDSASGITSRNPIFSPERLAGTLVGGYFSMLGIMCSDPKGLLILERWHIINMFYHIVELRDRDDLVRCLLTSLDYSLDSHPRIILSKALTAGSKQMRIMATRILRKYAIEPISSGAVGGGSSEWAIRLLVSQLYDPEIEVCEVAIKILEEACDELRSLEYVVKCRPALDHLGEIGAPLLLRFLSTSVGYHYLDGLDYITREMDDWFLGRNDSYVTVVEASLARALSDTPEKPQSFLEDHLGPLDYGHVPPHFYRELTRTAEGCELLQAKRHFEEFAATIQESAMEDEDPETILKLKGCLWAVGNVGSMELGGPFLERTDVVACIVQIAEQSRVMSLRGTAFFVLGLISRSLHGQEILAEHGWDGTVNVMGESLGYVLPLNLSKIFSIKPFDAAHGRHNSALIASRPAPVTDSDPTNAAILKAITKLGNTVLMNKVLGELRALKEKKVPGFQSPLLFQKAINVLSAHAYRIPQYRLVIDLFDKSVLRRIVLEEDSSDDWDDSDDPQPPSAHDPAGTAGGTDLEQNRSEHSAVDDDATTNDNDYEGDGVESDDGALEQNGNERSEDSGDGSDSSADESTMLAVNS